MKIFTFLFLLFGLTSVQAQQRQFSVVNFAHDPFDLTAKNDQYKKIDGNGSLYAIIKVTSTSPDDQLRDYRFNFGNMNHEVVARDGELWVYVQRNAKMVTISRQGFATINKYDLKTTVEAGNTYTMQLSPAAAKVLTQMVMFSVNPPSANATITVRSEDGNDDNVLGITDESGAIAANLPYGSYTYRILAEGYYTTEGKFILNDVNQTHVEKADMKAKFGMVTLHVDADADIYINGELRGHQTWTGRLNSGQYVVGCRQANHRSTTQTITIEENMTRTFELPAPEPITGTLAVMSKPLGANITVDGQPQGTTPRNITGLLVGRHTIEVYKEGYANATQSFDITEDQITNLNLTLNKGQSVAVSLTEPVQKEQTISNSVGNPSANFELYTKYRRRCVTTRTIGWIGGVSMLALGGLLVSNADHQEDSPGVYLMAASIPLMSGVFSLANSYKRKAYQYQSTSDVSRLYSKSANRLKWRGGIGGVMLAGLGVYFIADDGLGFSNSISSSIGVGLLASSALWTIPHFLSARANSKLAKRYKTTAYQFDDFLLKDRTSLSASIDVLNDQITHKKTLGLGLQYHF